MLKIPLPSEEYDTFNGSSVFHELGSIPQDGTEMSVEIIGCVLQI